jgi:superfamily II DNA or RNA helicase
VRTDNLDEPTMNQAVTATPFREDGRTLPGKIIYNYPLQAAQEEGFFRPIRFLQVFEPDDQLADASIAAAAVGRLREDLEAGYDHLLLARANTIEDATRLYRHIYLRNHADLNPVLIHSNSPNRRQILGDITNEHLAILGATNNFLQTVTNHPLTVIAS